MSTYVVSPKQLVFLGLCIVQFAHCGGDGDPPNPTGSSPNEAPEVRILSPGSGTTVTEGAPIEFKGEAIDPEEGSLGGDALLWTSSTDGGLGVGVAVSRSDLTPGEHVITLEATDSNGATSAASVDLNINGRPSATISTPVDGSTFESGVEILFSGGADDPEDGALEGESLEWSSDKDGPLGSGPNVTRKALSVGDHSIRLVATDSKQAADSAIVAITIIPAPTVGAIQLTVASSGEDVPEEYTIVLNDDESRNVSSNSSTTFAELEPGDYTLELTNVPENCAISGENPVVATVSAGMTTTVDVDVICEFNTGSIRVSTESSGPIDWNGYYVWLGDSLNVRIAVNGSVQFDDVPAGDHLVHISDVAGHCSVPDGDTREVAVRFGETVELTFVVVCAEKPSRIAFVSDRAGTYDVYIMTPEGTGLTNLTNSPTNDILQAWSPDDLSVAFRRNGDLYTVSLAGGSPLRLTDLPGTERGARWSPDGLDIAFYGFPSGTSDIFVVSKDGPFIVNLTNSPGNDMGPEWSPDGSKLAFYSDRTGDDEIYLMNRDGSGVTNLSNHPASDLAPAWSPDGSRIAFSSDRTGVSNIYTMSADGSNLVQVTDAQEPSYRPIWSPDGSQLAFVRLHEEYYEVYVVEPDLGGAVRLTDSPGDNNFPSWSPDGQRLVFASSRTGDNEVFVMNADGSDQVNLSASAGGDLFPLWSP